jgi:hypothetical protein
MNPCEAGAILVGRGGDCDPSSAFRRVEGGLSNPLRKIDTLGRHSNGPDRPSDAGNVASTPTTAISGLS